MLGQVSAEGERGNGIWGETEQEIGLIDTGGDVVFNKDIFGRS